MKLRMLVNSLLILVGAGIGLAVGLALREKPISKAQRESVGMSEGAQTNAAPVSKKQIAIRSNDDSPLATKLERDLSMSSGVTCWLHWLEALEKAGPADFPRLMRLAQGDSTARSFVAARWVEVAPRQLFDIVIGATRNVYGVPIDGLAQTLFEEWPKRDPDAVIAAINEAGTAAVREHWRFDVAYSIVEKDVERGLKLMAQWHAADVGFGPSGLAAVSKWASANPRHAAEFILDQPPTHSVQSTIKPLAKEWAKIDPASALEFAVGHSGTLGSVLASSVMKEWAERNPTEAANWLGTADSRTRNRLSPTFVEARAKQDFAGALEWCGENLTGSSLAQAVGGVVKGAAEKDVTAAAELVARMGSSPARAEGAVAVAAKWFPRLSSDKTVAPEAITWLANLDGESMRRVMNEVTWGWSTSDPTTMAAFLKTADAYNIPTYAYTVLARRLARKNPLEALEWAGALPEGPALAAGSDAFAEWRSSQADAAMKWLNDLSPADPRQQPYFEKAVQLIAHHSQGAEQLAAMNATERTAARRVIENMTLSADRRTSLLEALNP